MEAHTPAACCCCCLALMFPIDVRGAGAACPTPLLDADKGLTGATGADEVTAD